jgi:predicted SAM-dependent methyltransferase
MLELIKFDLGGVGAGKNGYKTVNLVATCDIKENIIELDKFCDDNSVDEFYLSHTVEHIPVTHYKQFLLDLKRKLKTGGCIKVIQTDVGRLIKMWADGEISFRTMRTPIFTPASRCHDNLLQQHQSMWNADELIKDFESIGMSAKSFDAGYWKYDLDDDLVPEDTKKDFGKLIPNLGVIASKV